MTSPDGVVPSRTYQALDIYQSQTANPQDLAAVSNAELQQFAEEARQQFIEGVVNTLIPSLANMAIVEMLRMLADLLNMVPIVGDNMATVVNQIADGINQTNQTAITAQSTANTANTTAGNAYDLANSVSVVAQQAQKDAGTAISAAEAAANAAAAAQETADIAYDNASYWEAECVVSSAEVLLGANELLIGLCQNVPTGKNRVITDLHFALNSNPGGVTVETRKWDWNGTVSTTLHTQGIGAGVTRISAQNLGIQVSDKERLYWYVTWIGGGTPPVVLQVLAFGAIY